MCKRMASMAFEAYNVRTYMILIDAVVRQCFLAQLEARLVEATSNRKPTLIVGSFVAILQLDFSILSVKTSAIAG